MKTFNILGIETSCDETSVAILRIEAGGVQILHHEIASQIAVHAMYGGVVPEVAARLHVAEIAALLDRALGVDKPLEKFDAIAVTRGPGLATALRVGVESARTIAFASGKPLIGVNHLEGHLASVWLVKENRDVWQFPTLALLVSGGHTELVLMKDFCKYRVLGRTRDDAAGEAFDKTAKLMGLGYPGGPAIETWAAQGNPAAFPLPRPMLHDGSLDFSFSGLKTAVRNVWEGLSKTQQADEQMRADLCASIQAAILDVLVRKTMTAVRKYQPRAVSIVGGVSASVALQHAMEAALQQEAPEVRMLKPARGLHTDNAAMIAAAGAWHIMKGESHDWKRMDADPEIDL